ncbi:hypothetical protein [Carboxylicivirga marina]|uniref:hypothetical protein n=1 Tax=Carboxylicivirga marina TaxID=2800988 RepID=UPI002599F403|nr:hypothetical protein [uncultured Carboxylicivirga sp.]
MNKNRIYRIVILLLFLTSISLIILLTNSKSSISSLEEKVENQATIIKNLNQYTKQIESNLTEARSNIKKQKIEKKVSASKEFNDYVTDSLIRSIAEYDLDRFKLTIRKIGKYEFDKLTAKNQSNKYENIHHVDWKENTDENTERVNDSIFVFKLDSGIKDSLNNEDIGQMSFSAYKYAGFIDEINSYLFAGQYFEAHDCVLINKNTGNKKKLKHHVVSSPKNQTLITYDWDNWVYVSGGITIYNIVDKKLKKRLEFYPPGCNSYLAKGCRWSFSDVNITSKNSIVFTCEFQDAETSQTYNCYALMNLKEK